ncbi:hypothetical protein ACIBG7_42135 [Nonomuraea sp. NPDC050328]|uniref:hypothetical protein n=1 Tax=Nonomuraea sp. NPDC050328 TaxID=3364361 RepID=UPI00379CD087
MKVGIVQPGGCWTDLRTGMTTTTPAEPYGPLRAEPAAQWAGGSIDSDPPPAAKALLELVDSPEPPLLLGSMVYDLAFDRSRRRREVWAGWEETSRAAEHAIPRHRRLTDFPHPPKGEEP